MNRHAMPDVIVVLPGIMGSVLSRHGQVVWGFTPGSIARALITGGGAIASSLMLEDDDEERESLDDGVTADALLPDLHLLPGLWKINGYSRLCQMIESRFEVTYGENYFHFAYDWRRSNRASARRLKRLADGWLRRWRGAGHPQARLILLAHSMGGLVASHYLEVLEGWRDARALISLGTPYRGAPKALDALANGLRKGPLVFDELTRFARSCTSIHQLLPIYAAVSDAGATQRVADVEGLPGVNAQKAVAALGFHREIQGAVQAHQGDAVYRQQRCRVFPVAGISQPTLQSALFEGGRVTALGVLDGEDLGGDGTVPRVSALPQEFDASGVAMYTAALHGSLQDSDAVLQHVEGTITSLYIDLGKYLAVDRRVPLSMQAPDLLFDDEPLVLEVGADDPGRSLRARVLDSTSGREVAVARLKDRGDASYAASLGPLPPGSYHVEVAGDGVLPIADAFGVGSRA